MKGRRRVGCWRWPAAWPAGGAKLALGLARILPPEQLTIVVNTGDDEEFHGLHVSPDLDTMTYTLSGWYNQETGWGWPATLLRRWPC